MKQRFVRLGGELVDETVVVVRGGALVREVIQRDAERAYRI